MWSHKERPPWGAKAKELTSLYLYPLQQKEYGLKIRSHSRDAGVTYILRSVSARCAGTRTQMHKLLWDHTTEAFIRAVRCQSAPQLENWDYSAGPKEAELQKTPKPIPSLTSIFSMCSKRGSLCKIHVVGAGVVEDAFSRHSVGGCLRLENI